MLISNILYSSHANFQLLCSIIISINFIELENFVISRKNCSQKLSKYLHLHLSTYYVCIYIQGNKYKWKPAKGQCPLVKLSFASGYSANFEFRHLHLPPFCNCPRRDCGRIGFYQYSSGGNERSIAESNASC